MISAGADKRTVHWVGALFLLVILFQRFGIPGVPGLGLLVLIVLAWVVVAAARGIVVIDSTRLTFWLAAAGVTAASMLLQARFVPNAEISVPAWFLVVSVWFPFTTKLKVNNSATYVALLTRVVTISSGLSVLTIAMVGTQLVGIRYRDWFSEIVPSALQLQGFNTVASTVYGSAISRGNAWIGLEPSMVSMQIATGLLAALFVRAKPWQVLLLILGMIATVSGSGIVLMVVGVLVMLVHRSRRLLVPYSVLGLVTVVLSAFTPFGRLLLNRTTELQTGNSSASLRALQPYTILSPKWTEHLSGVLLGYGPGSSQRMVADLNILGLLVPSPIKVFFDYGLIGGSVLAVFILGCYWSGPSRAFSFTLLFSLWTLQPGITTSAVVTLVMVLVTLWSPRDGLPIESLPTSRMWGWKRTVGPPVVELKQVVDDPSPS